MTRLGDTRVVRETSAIINRRPLVIELHALILRIRTKGARWAYDVDYESIFHLGAKKAAEQRRTERSETRRRSMPR